MGTRCTTQVYDEHDNVIANIYCQFDGYYEGFGVDLAKFLSQRKICNGFSNETAGTHANGVGCLAAQIVSYFKVAIGNIYLFSQDYQEEYNYSVIITTQQSLKTVNWGKDNEHEELKTEGRADKLDRLMNLILQLNVDFEDSEKRKIKSRSVSVKGSRFRKIPMGTEIEISDGGIDEFFQKSGFEPKSKGDKK